MTSRGILWLSSGGASLEVITPTKSIITIDSFTLEGFGVVLPLLDLTKNADFTVSDAPRQVLPSS